MISGGQTGVDRGALDAALFLGIPCGGKCPRGRRAEDGTIPPHYPLTEMQTSEYAHRTVANVRESDATLVVTISAPTGGTLLTIKNAERLDKCHFVLDLHGDERPALANWLSQYRPSVLNVAGPRESKFPGIAQQTYALLVTLWGPPIKAA